MANNNINPWRRILNATGYSLAGLLAAYRNEQAFRQELLVFLLVVPCAFLVGESALEYIFLIGSWMLVMIVELLNSGIEAVVDRIGPEHNELAGRAKDLGSAAVMLTIMLSVLAWALILFAP
jgi:diacylglycerol kinase (ATP)